PGSPPPPPGARGAARRRPAPDQTSHSGTAKATMPGRARNAKRARHSTGRAYSGKSARGVVRPLIQADDVAIGIAEARGDLGALGTHRLNDRASVLLDGPAGCLDAV